MKELRQVFSYAKPYKKDFILGILCVIAETSFELIIPMMMADIIDVGIVNKDIHLITVKGVEMSICALLALFTGLFYARFTSRAANSFGAHLREAEYEKIQAYSFSNLDHFEGSSLITRMTTDITVMQNTVSAGLRPLVRSPVMFFLGIILAFRMNAKLALVFLVCAPFLGVILFFILKKIGPMFSKLQKAVDHVNAIVQENLTAIRAVKAFVRDEYEEENFDQVNKNLMETSGHTFRYAVLNLPAFQLTMYTSIVLILWFGGHFIQTGGMKVGQLTGFLSYVMQIVNSLMLISNVFLMLTRSLASARRIGEVLEECPDLLDPENALTSVADGSISFEHVYFKYRPDAREFALSDVSAAIGSGQTIGIIGGTGASKSTFVQLIPRLYDATCGDVFVGGKNVRSYKLSALRDSVGIVLQKNVLFSGSIRSNLLWGNPQATTEELERACYLSCADEFISRLPQGLDTDLSQGGVNLSGGQKQRLCIARTLLKKPRILIFDDSTSAVDTATEKKMQKRLASMEDMTIIIIAQRITSVMHANRIFILEDGKIHASGDHKSLLASDSIYQEIYESQMKGGEALGTSV